MLLPILLFSILFSANAGCLSLTDEKVNQIPKLYPELKQISNITDLLTPTLPEDAQLTTMELISKYGYNGELHRVTTSDGYILELHRITGRANSTDLNIQKPIAFVMHGILCDSASWVITREKSLAFILADEGYDVWLGNARGNPYAHTHTNPNITKSEYWNFSWHEIGTRDLPAMIDYVVKTTGRRKMFYLGHSQGTTSFFVMATERPEYQEYIEEMYAMAPIAYCGRLKSPFLQLLSQCIANNDLAFKLLGYNDINPNSDFIKAFEELICAKNAITQPVCSNLVFLVAGFDPEQLDPSVIPVALGHVPADTATKQFVHYAQLIKSGKFFFPGKFQQYDHGLKNLKIYGSLHPPKYDLSKIKTSVHLYYSQNDWLANVKDVGKLYSELSNPSGKTLIADKKFNHVDYLWGKDVKTLVYDLILGEMKKKL
ncbi:lipase 3 isoform X2 [Monomorium pharaonis]|uniref:lipase 3 isoform X2 n=1 Tax=Monomorium pharaonis TaxID=307658 RepID=UPI00063F01EB|nr:lipase 3 isoform X2 [Monomorium pharaonis]